jgi:hypothetical protein
MPGNCEFEKRTKPCESNTIGLWSNTHAKIAEGISLEDAYARMQGLGFGKCDGIPLLLDRAINFS